MFPKEISLIICQYNIDFSVNCDINCIDYIVPLIDKNISKNFFCKLLWSENMEIIYKFINQFLYLDTEKSFDIIIKKKYIDIFEHVIHNYLFQGILRGEIYINPTILQNIVKRGTLEMIKKISKLIDFKCCKYSNELNDIDDDILKIVVTRSDVEIFKFLLEEIDSYNKNLYIDYHYHCCLLGSTRNIEIIKILRDKMDYIISNLSFK